jgi:peptide deformylase
MTPPQPKITAPILKVTDPAEHDYLLLKTAPVTISDSECAKILYDTLSGLKDACGLHARQIGHGNNVFAIMIPNGPQYMFFGAKDVVLSGKMVGDREQCLSEVDANGRMVPYHVARAEIVEFTTEDGLRHKLDGFCARVVQHELDHGSGILLENNPRAQSMAPVTGKKLPGRNEPCYCGSKKKFKHCCGGV